MHMTGTPPGRAAHAAILLCLWWPAVVAAQIDVRLASTRDSFLLYEPMVFQLQIDNRGEMPLALKADEGSGRNWLQFQIFGAGGEKIPEVTGKTMAPLLIGQGENRNLDINITPHYQLRTSGTYDIRAVVNVPGASSYLTPPLRFVVGRGETIWTQKVPINGVERVYSLIRYLEQRDANLYLRVEEPSQNTVYCTTRLGTVVSFTDPVTRFDAEGGLHVLHVDAAQRHRYTHAASDGRILKQENRFVRDRAPALVDLPGGGIGLAGGVKPEEPSEKRFRSLSEDQQGM